MSPEFQRILDSKREMRRTLAARPIAVKLRMVEELSERALAARKDTAPAPPDAPWPIPTHWHWRRMSDVSSIVGGGTPRTDRPEYFGGDVPWITPADLSKYEAKIISRGRRNITVEGLANSGAQILPKGTVLFSSRAPIGYVAIAANPVATNQGFKSFALHDEVIPDFVYYYLQRAKDLVVSLASGTTFLEISGKKAAQIPIPVPPIPEQRRIVAEIEKQFTRLEAGVAALKRVQANLKRYRAAILKAACEGRLVPTEAELARKKPETRNLKPEFETGEQLLARILAERRKHWLARRSLGDGGTGKGKYKEPATTGTTGLPKLPEGWCCATVEQLNLANRPCAYGVLQPGDDLQDGIPFVRVGDINDGKLDTSNLKMISPVIAAQYPRTKLQGGELAITLVGAIGRTAIIPDSLAGGNTARAVGIVPLSKLLSAHWVEIWFRNPRKIAEMTAKSHEVARKTLNLEDVRAASVALPPLAEQTRIVAEVERRLSVVDELEAVVTANLQRASRLRKSTLQTAFTGG